MQDCKPSLTPMEINLKLSKFEGGELVDNTIYRQLIGSLIYLTTTHPYLSYGKSIGMYLRGFSLTSKVQKIMAKYIQEE